MTLRGRPVRARYAYHQVADEIQKQIFDGSIKPGERLPGEMELAEMFGVTRSTVREGLRQLENDGLVHRPSPRRLEVCHPGTDALTSRASRTMMMMGVTFRDLWQVSMVTEPLAAELAAQNITDPEKAELRAIHERLLGITDDLLLVSKIDTQFHSFIAEATKNRVLTMAREPVSMLLYRGFAQVAPLAKIALPRQAEAHTHIVEAICAHDADLARTWMRRHINDFWKAIQNANLQDSVPAELPNEDE